MKGFAVLGHRCGGGEPNGTLGALARGRENPVSRLLSWGTQAVTVCVQADKGVCVCVCGKGKWLGPTGTSHLKR